VAALVVGVLVARPYLGQFWNYIRDQTATPSAVNPVRESASSVAPGHPAHAAFDGVSNRCWMPNRAGGATNQYLEVNFTPAVRMLKVVVLPGCSPDKNQFVQQGRPSGLRFEMRTADHRNPIHQITLADQPGPQTFTLREAAVTAVRIVITGSYGAQPRTRVAIAEIEFYRRG
jgi:hypothetical protein